MKPTVPLKTNWNCERCNHQLVGNRRRVWKKFVEHCEERHPDIRVCVTCLKLFPDAQEAGTHCSEAPSHNLPKLPKYYISRIRQHAVGDDRKIMVPKSKIRISIVVIGHVDSGKSTTTGHLLHKLGVIDKSVMERVKEEAALYKKSNLKFAWLLDKLKAERERGVTIDSSSCTIETDNHYCTLIDAPGHRDYIKNMITGTAKSNFAVIIIDSSHGAFETGISKDGLTREHILLAYVLGVKDVICCLNKMDSTSPKYSKARYETIVKKISSYLNAVGFKTEKIPFIPISGLEGDNLTYRSTNLEWYNGPTLLEAINNLSVPRMPSHKPLRAPLVDVYHIGGIGTVPIARVEAGILKSRMLVTFGPTGLTCHVKAIEMNHNEVKNAYPRDIVGLSFDESISRDDLKRGYVASNCMDDPAKEAASFTSQITVINHHEIRNGYVYVLDCHTSNIPVKFVEILSKIDRRSGEELEKYPKFLKNGECGMVKMLPMKPMVVETFSDYPPLGRFAVRDRRQTVAVGVVKSVEKKACDCGYVQEKFVKIKEVTGFGLM